jgi:hypothetical protein
MKWLKTLFLVLCLFFTAEYQSVRADMIPSDPPVPTKPDYLQKSNHGTFFYSVVCLTAITGTISLIALYKIRQKNGK